jgi:cell filamentation protein
MSPFPNDPYCYPGTDILRNLAEIRDPGELRIFEADAVAVNIVELRRNGITGPFDASRLKETHRRIFGNVYPWAGEFRQGIGMMTKDRSGFVVAYGPSENVPAALAATFAALNAENGLRGLDADRFAARLAFYCSELDAIHAFREGNSRTLRAFTSDLSQAAGHRLDWAKAALVPDDQQRLYHARDLAVMRGDTSELARIIASCLSTG